MDEKGRARVNNFELLNAFCCSFLFITGATWFLVHASLEVPCNKPEHTKLNDREEDADKCRLSNQRANLKEPTRGKVRIETAEEFSILEALFGKAPRCHYIQNSCTKEGNYEYALHGVLSYIWVLVLFCAANKLDEASSEDEANKDNQEGSGLCYCGKESHWTCVVGKLLAYRIVILGCIRKFFIH